MIKFILYIPLAISLSLAIDWAIFEKMRRTFVAFYEFRQKNPYRYFLFPRILVSSAASLTILYAFIFANRNLLIIITAAIFFTLAAFYPFFAVLRGEK